jgi:hypothetical protein
MLHFEVMPLRSVCCEVSVSPLLDSEEKPFAPSSWTSISIQINLSGSIRTLIKASLSTRSLKKIVSPLALPVSDRPCGMDFS